MTKPKSVRTRDKTTNWAAYNAALKVRGSLTIWLDKDMPWYAPASTTALDLLVDSTGIKFLGEGECKRKKHGAEYRQQSLRAGRRRGLPRARTENRGMRR